MSRHRTPIAFSVIVALALSLAGCDTPDAVSQFCGSAVATLTSAGPVFDDLRLSCLREVNSRQAIGAFQPPVETDATCNEISAKAEGAVAATQLIAAYFGALNSLASFGTAQVSVNASDLLAKTSAAFGANSDTQLALGGIAQFITSLATVGHQQKKLADDLMKTKDSVPRAIAALITVVNDDYIGRLLKPEEQKLSVQYREFARDKSPEALLLLNERWRTDEAALEARRASAQDLAAALQSLSSGFSDVAANANKLTAKELTGLLAPYVSQLQTLIPEIQKAF